MKGYRRWIAGVTVLGAMAIPAGAHAADCTLSGSGQEGPIDTTFYQPATGELKASMIFVDFPDHTLDPSEADPELTIGPKLVDWATDYLSEVSGGRATLDVKMDDRWLRMNQDADQYSFQTFAGQRNFVLEAVGHADAGFDFSGREIIYVVSAPNGELNNSPAFIAFNNEAIVADGARIRWGSSMGDDVRFVHPDLDANYGSHILAHETGHTFGLPDLYTFSKPFNESHLNAGAWDLMGWIGPGLGFSGWHRLKLGWLDPAQAICVDGESTATLSPLAEPGGAKMLVSKTSPSTAYVAEVRAPTGVDTPMCDPGGVLVYRVDANAATGAPVDQGPILVELAHPGDPGDPNDVWCSALSKAPFELNESFSGGGVTVQVVSGTPATGFSVRMTGPPNPSPTDPTSPTSPTDPRTPTNPTDSKQTGGIERKLRMDGKKRVVAALTCPAGASSCAGTLTLELRDGPKLATGAYSVAPPGGDVPLKLKRKARKALAKEFGKKDKAKATAVLEGAAGKVTQKVKLLR